MTTDQIKTYYDSTESSEIRSDLLQAVELVKEPRIAIDCGCGAGADIEFLTKHDFTVYGFDIEYESIKRCKDRFRNNNKVILSRDSFNTFIYPRASLILADASLFFCPTAEFDAVWQKIYESLFVGGIFCGSFLGPNDTMTSSKYSKENFWSVNKVFSENDVKSLFTNYAIINFTEHNTSGKTVQGDSHNWHIFSVVAIKV